MCNRVHRVFIFGHGCICTGGAFAASWHPWHSLTIFSMSRSILGQYVCLRIKAFIVDMSGWPLWNSFRILLCSVVGMMTLSAYIKVYEQIENGEIFESFFDFSFNCTCFFIFTMNSSVSAALLMLSRVTGNSRIVLHSSPESSFSSLNAAITVSSKGSTHFQISLDSSFACPIFLDEMYSILKL